MIGFHSFYQCVHWTVKIFCIFLVNILFISIFLQVLCKCEVNNISLTLHISLTSHTVVLYYHLLSDTMFTCAMDMWLQLLLLCSLFLGIQPSFFPHYPACEGQGKDIVLIFPFHHRQIILVHWINRL